MAKLTKKERGKLLMSTGWTEDELNNPLVQEAIRRKEEELKRQEELARNPFANVQSEVSTVPAAPEEQSGLSALLDSLDESISRNRQAHRDALVGGGKRSLGAGMQAAKEHGQVGLAAALRGVYETLNFEQGGLAGYVLRDAFQPDQVESGAELFQEGSKQVANAYEQTQKNTSLLGRELSGAVVDVLGSPSSGASIVGGPAGLIAGLDTYAQEYASGRASGLSKEQADKRAAIHGTIEGGISTLPTGKAFERLIPSGVRRELMDTVSRIVTNIAATAGAEAAEEVATTAGQLLADKALSGSDDPMLAQFADENLPKDSAGVAEALWRSARAGGLMGGAVRTPGALLDAAATNAQHAAQIIASGEQAAAERDKRRSTKIEPVTVEELQPSSPVQGELFGGESSPFIPAEAPVAPSKPKVDLGPDLFPEARQEALRSRAEASKLLDKEQKSIQAKAKSSRAAARRSFLTKLVEDTRNLPREQRIETIARATEQWDNNNPLEAFVAKVTEPKVKGRKGKKSKAASSGDLNVKVEDLLAKFDGLQQKSVEDPASEPPSEGGAIERVFRTMVKKVGKGDVKVLNKLMQDGNLKVVEDTSFLPGKPKDSRTKGYYDGKTTYIVARNLDQDNIVGDMLSVAAHEVKHAGDVSGKVSVRGLVGDKANNNLVTKIEALAAKDSNVAGLVNDLKESYDNPNVYKLELPAHFINLALDKKNNTLLVKRVLDDAVSAIRTGAKNKLGIDDVSLKDVGYLAKQLLKEAAVSGERLEGDVTGKIKGNGLEMIGGRKGAGYNQALVDDRVYIGRVDKKPRFEFSDHESSVNKPVLDALRRTANNPNSHIRLNVLLNHDELFRQYPQLKDYRVIVDDSIGTPQNNANGYFQGGKNKTLAISPKIAESPDKAHSVLLHEVQHAIQEIEGHDPGASPKQFESRQVRDNYNEARARYNTLLESVDLEDALDSLPPRIRERWVSKFGNTQSTGNPDLDKEAIHNFLTGAWVNWSTTEYRDKAEEYKSELARFNKATKALDEDKDKAFNKYRAVYGEAEARTTELRRKLTPEERELITPEEDMKYAAGKIPVERTTPSPKTAGTIEESVDDSFEERRQKKAEEEAVRKMREAGEVLKTQKDAEDDNDAANDDTPEGLAFLPRKYTVGNTAVKEALRVAERLLWSGGFVNSTLKELSLHASHLPASLMVKATKYGNDMLNAIDRNAAEAGKGKSADEQRKIRQRLRVDLGKEIERIDQLPTKAARDAALAALDRNPRFKGIGQAVRAIRDFKMELTREIIALRARNPKPMTEKEVAIYNKMIENAERYTTRAYLATYNDKIGLKYGKNLWKRFERDPDSLEGKIVQRALDFLETKELIIPDEDSIHKLGTTQLRRLYENWIGSASSLKGEKGRRKMIRDLLDLPEKTKEEINAKAVEIVKDMLNLNKNKGISARFYSIGAKQNRTILEARTDMPPELRALMGEITDPFLREAISLQRMINLSAKTKLLTEVFEAGTSRNWWSDVKTDDHETQLNDIAYGPLNGKWINRDLEDALTGTIMSLESTDKMIADAIHNPTAFSQYLAGKSVRLLTGLSRVQKTYRIVFSFAQMGFNAGGAFLNAMGVNGILNPMTLGKGAKDALLVLTSEINSKVINEKNLPTIQEIVRAGVIDSATVGEFKSQAYQNITEQIQKLDPDQPGFAQKTMQVFWNFVSAQGDIPNAVRQIYAYMDVWTKVATYHDRKKFLTEYNRLEKKGWTEEQIQRRAGYEASGTNISYERAIPLAKIIEKNLPFGMFLTYFSEVPRTIGTSFIQAGIDAKMAMDAKTPEAKRLATTKAVTRFLGTTAASGGVIAATLAALDSDDEEEKKRRRLDPEWMQNKYTLPIGLDEDGHTVLFEVNRFDPNGPLNEAIVAVLSAEEGKRAEAVYNQVLGLFVPAQGAIAVYRTIHDMLVETAARATGNASLYDLDMRSKRTVMERNYPEQFAKLKRILGYGDFGENVVAAIEQLWLPASAQPLVDQKGKVVTVRPQDTDMENLPQGLGYRPYVRNPDESFDFRIRDYDNSIKEIMKDRAKLIRDADKLDESTLISELNDLVGREKEAFDQLRYNYEGYMAYEDKSLQDAARHFDSKKLFAQVRYNRFQPRVLSQESLQRWAKEQVREGRDRQEVMKVYKLLRRLYTETGE